MINVPDPGNIIWHLRFAALRIKHFFSSVRFGISMYCRYTLYSAEERSLARDMRASLYGDLRDRISDEAIERLGGLCATWRRATRVWDEADPVIRFIVEPARRNMVENCEMLEDVTARLKQSANAEASSPEQDPATARESDS